MIELHVETTESGWRFTARDLGELVVERHGEHAILHNTLNRWSRDLLRVYREMFADIRAVLRAQGINLMVAPSVDTKTQKFWRLMGFECFGTVEHVHFAVMEA